MLLSPYNRKPLTAEHNLLLRSEMEDFLTALEQGEEPKPGLYTSEGPAPAAAPSAAPAVVAAPAPAAAPAVVAAPAPAVAEPCDHSVKENLAACAITRFIRRAAGQN